MEEEVLEKFYEYLSKGDHFGDRNISYAAWMALSHYLDNCNEITKSGFLEKFNAILGYLIENADYNHGLARKEESDEALNRETSELTATNSIGVRNITLRAACNFWYHIFTKLISKNPEKEMDKMLQILKTWADALTKLAYFHSKDKIIKNARKLWRDDITILTHGYSSIVFNLIKSSAELGFKITVYVTEARPENSGELMRDKLTECNVAVKYIIDSSVASIMAKVNYVFLGAEAVVENGGIINKIGTYTVSLWAKALKKKVYVFAESIKFIMTLPLDQSDIASVIPEIEDFDNLSSDYTPPDNISLLITDLGISTPYAASDVLNQLLL